MQTRMTRNFCTAAIYFVLDIHAFAVGASSYAFGARQIEQTFYGVVIEAERDATVTL